MKSFVCKISFLAGLAACATGLAMTFAGPSAAPATTAQAAYTTADRELCQNLARVLAEPVSENDAPEQTAITYSREHERLQAILTALEYAPADPQLRDIWKTVQPAALECSALLDRVGQIDRSKPGDLLTLGSFIHTLITASSGDKDDGVFAKASNLKDTWDASESMRERIGAEMNLDSLRGEYRVASCQLRNVAEMLFEKGAAAVGNAQAPECGMVGVVMEIDRGDVQIESVVAGSPAARAGIRAGERIQAIDGEPLHGVSLVEARRRLTGFADTFTDLSVCSADQPAHVVKIRREPVVNSSPLVNGYATSLNGSYDSDTLTLSNPTSRTLHHCLVLVKASDGQLYRPHLHYLETWKPGATISCAYREGDGEYSFDNTCDNLRELSVQIISDELKHEFHKTYTDEERDAALKEFCAKLEFSAGHLAFDPGFFWNDDRGAQFSFSGVARVHPSKVTVTLVERGIDGERRSVAWNGPVWASEKALGFRDESFNYLHPEGIVLELEFPNIHYRPRFYWGAAQP